MSRSITNKDIEFLRNLQQEIQVGDKEATAAPNFWMIQQSDSIYGDKLNNPDGMVVIDSSSGESQEIQYDFEIVKKYLIENEICNEQELSDCAEVLELLDHAKENLGEFIVLEYQNYEYLASNALFLTKDECKKHLAENSHHYHEEAHSYGMCGWRSHNFARLMDIVPNVDFSTLEVKQ